LVTTEETNSSKNSLSVSSREMGGLALPPDATW